MGKRTFETMDDLTEVIDDLAAAEEKLRRVRALCEERDPAIEYQYLNLEDVRAILDERSGV